MVGASNFDKMCHQVFGTNIISRDANAVCRYCGTPTRAYYCEERLYLVECETCKMKALVKARNPQEAAYKTFAKEVE